MTFTFPEEVTETDGVLEGIAWGRYGSYDVTFAVEGPEHYSISVLADDVPVIGHGNVIPISFNAETIEITIRADGYETFHVIFTNNVVRNYFNKDTFTFAEDTTPVYVPFQVGNGQFTLSTDFPASSTRDVFLLSGNVTSGINSNTNGVDAGRSRTQSSADGYVTIATRYNDQRPNPADYKYYLVEGSTPYPVS